MAASSDKIFPAIFQNLQARIDEDTALRDELRDIIQTLEKHSKTLNQSQIVTWLTFADRNASFVLSRAHSTPVAEFPEVLGAAEEPLKNVIDTVAQLSKAASKVPYYKFNNMWSRQVQTSVESVLLWGWLGGYKHEGGAVTCGRLLTIDELAEIFRVPANLKDRDEFHLSLEEYLQALITLVEELTRLARNAVTLGDYERPLLINQFVKDLHAGFQILNLKNDSLRRRSDGLKYRVKDVEDVVYDLSLRNLLPKKSD